MPRLQRFSEYFQLGRSQHELDFIDIPVNNGDIPLFVDPYAISKRSDRWSENCHLLIVNFFQGLIEKIKQGDRESAKKMLSGLREPNQTRLGLSHGKKPRGRGIGPKQADSLHHALASSTAIRTGFIKDLEECELLIDGIGRDKISDITTNIIRGELIRYTQAQCELWSIPMASVSSGPVWDATENAWVNQYVDLPVCNEKSVLLVPKTAVRFDIELNHKEYYQHFVLNFLQAEHLHARTSLVRTLKNGTLRPPTKKSLKPGAPLKKSFLYEFSQEHPDVLAQYKKSKTHEMTPIRVEDIQMLSPQTVERKIDTLTSELDSIPVGDAGAETFHKFILGALTAIFYPNLINPKKEQPIHDGRKRIDIAFQNASTSGFFHQLSNNKGIPSAYVFAECKNYTGDLGNQELDQLAGRFSVNRGKFGFLVCRRFKDKKLFIKRCNDTAKDGRGCIIVLDDEDIKKLLTYRKNEDYASIESYLDERFREIVM